MTERIRWEPNGDGSSCGHVAAQSDHAFLIWRADAGAGKWRLTSDLTDQDEWQLFRDDPDALKAEAERWLEEFVSSLGAVWPEKRTCPRCYGSGTDSSVNRNDCPACDGSGSVWVPHKPKETAR